MVNELRLPARYTFDEMMLQPCTNMLYVAAETVRDRTVLELRDVHATWIGWAKSFC